MTYLTKSDLLKPAVRRYLEFNITIDGEPRTCRIQSLTERERSDYEAAMQLATGKNRSARMKDAKRRLIVLCVVDENNEPMLTMADVKQLEDVDSAITSAIFDRCVEHVGFGGDDIEELVGNSNDIGES